jgi:hypothetical protein
VELWLETKNGAPMTNRMNWNRTYTHTGMHDFDHSRGQERLIECDPQFDREDAMSTTCPICNGEGAFGYRNKETGRMTWYCAAHRLAQHWADARRDLQANGWADNDARPFQRDPPTAPLEPFIHHCHCGAWGAFGYHVNLRAGKPGEWFCAVHRPDR